MILESHVLCDASDTFALAFWSQLNHRVMTYDDPTPEHTANKRSDAADFKGTPKCGKC